MAVTANKRPWLFAIVALCALLLSVAACDSGSPSSQQNQDQTNNNSAAVDLHKVVPYPKLTWSNELANQAERYKRLNAPNEIGYVYVIAYNLIYGPYQVIGKCSSTESLYSSPASINTDNEYQGNGVVAVPAPQPDGSYGQNESAIFCFLHDANKTMVEFGGGGTGWIWTEKPLVGLPTVPGSAVVPDGK